RGRLPAVHRTPAARGVRLRRQPDPPAAAPPQEARAPLMRSPVPDYLEEVLRACQHVTGRPADYIPELAKADPSVAAIALSTVDDAHHSAGEREHRFTIQSMSKPFAYAVALERLGLAAVH